MIQPELFAATGFKFSEGSLLHEQIAMLVKQAAEQGTEDTRFIEQWGYHDGDVVYFGQASSTNLAAHVRITPSLSTPFFRPGHRYSKVKISPHYWPEPAQPGVPRSKQAALEVAAATLPPTLVLKTVKEFKLSLVKAYDAARDRCAI